MHELEERKNLHINELMNNHDRDFAELKKYFNNITAENLNLIKAQKVHIFFIFFYLCFRKKFHKSILI